MEKTSTRKKLRQAQKSLPAKKTEEKDIIERIIQEVRSKDIPIQKIINRLEEKKAEHQKKTKILNAVIFQIKKQHEKPRENVKGDVKSRSKEPGKKTGNNTERKGASKKTTTED